MTEPKIDGLAVSLVYENGGLSPAPPAATACGGENITQNLRTIRRIPMTDSGRGRRASRCGARST